MGIDASIYSQIKPAEMPSPLDAAKGAMTLSQLGMQQQQQQYQMAQLQATRQAYAQNTDPTGKTDMPGTISTLSRMGFGQQAQELGSHYAAQQKAQAEAQTAQMQAWHQHATSALANYGYLLNLDMQDPTGAAAQSAYPGIRQSMIDQGIPNANKMPEQYDRGLIRQGYDIANRTKEGLEAQAAEANIDKTKAETANIGFTKGADELAKFNEDVNNPSNRKMTGGLKDIMNRADRIIALSNAGAKPGETPAQRTARLNKVMPQIAKEYNLSLAYIMQGGVPTEGLAKELGTDTADSAIAELKQKFTGTPAGADQGKMIDEYVKTAQHLRNFASGRLQDVTERSKAAYPYARKYFPKEMDKIGAPTEAPEVGGGGQAQGQTQYRAAGAKVSGDEAAKYATRHKMKLSEAISKLRGAGYVID